MAKGKTEVILSVEKSAGTKLSPARLMELMLEDGKTKSLTQQEALSLIGKLTDPKMADKAKIVEENEVINVYFRCSTCKEWHSISEHGPQRSEGTISLQSKCRKCNKEYLAKRAKKGQPAEEVAAEQLNINQSAYEKALEIEKIINKLTIEIKEMISDLTPEKEEADEAINS